MLVIVTALLKPGAQGNGTMSNISMTWSLADARYPDSQIIAPDHINAVHAEYSSGNIYQYIMSTARLQENLEPGPYIVTDWYKTDSVGSPTNQAWAYWRGLTCMPV
jgi:hypothetical protein